MAFLLLVSFCSPVLPPFVLVLLFLLYALPATVGSMYNVVANRLHRQDLYNENGRLSQYNKRWLLWFSGFFVAYLVSALMFALQAPSWGFQEWALIWAAIAIYYVVFLVVQRLCRKEYSARYYRARAIKWSIFATAVLVTVVYAILAAQPPTDLQIDLHEIIQERCLPFEESPSAFLGEIEKLTTYANCLTEYGVGKLAGSSYVTSFAVKLFLGFSVFIGVVSQFGACLLRPREVRSVFQLLSAGDETEGTFQLRYLVVLAMLWAVLSGAFIWLNCVVEEVRATSEYTLVDEWVDDTSDWVVLAAEQDIELIKEGVATIEATQAFDEAFAEKRDAFVEDQMPQVLDQVNDYYDRCADRVESYAQWYDGFPQNAARLIPVVGENMVRDEFDRQVAGEVGDGALNERYGGFLDGLKQLYREYWSADEVAEFARQAQVPSADGVAVVCGLPSEPELWPAWDSEEGRRFVREVLMGDGADGDSRGVRERILDYLEKRREASLFLVRSMPACFFPLGS